MKRYQETLEKFKAKVARSEPEANIHTSSKEDSGNSSNESKKKKRRRGNNARDDVLSNKQDVSDTVKANDTKHNALFLESSLKQGERVLSSDKKSKKNILTTKDPSLKYMSNPQNAPAVYAARQFFKDHWTLNQQNINSASSKSNKFQVYCGDKVGWRTVAKLSVRGKEKPVIGLFAPNSHMVVPIPDNASHHPNINKALAQLERSIQEVKLNGYDGVNSGGLSYVAFSVQRDTGTVQCTLVFNDIDKASVGQDKVNQLIKAMISPTKVTDKEKGLKKKSEEGNQAKKAKIISGFSSRHEILQDNRRVEDGSLSLEDNVFHSIWLHFHPASRHDNSIFAHDDKAWECVYGNKEGVEEYFTHIPSPFREQHSSRGVGGGTKSNQGSEKERKLSTKSMQSVLFFPPFVFRQANLNGFENIVKVIRKYLVLPSSPTFKNEKLNVCELYGGVGTIGLNILDKVASLSCSDENPNNEACFMRSLRRLRDTETASAGSHSQISKNISYTTGSATKMVVDLHELRGKDICIVDPPRKGLDKEVTDALLYEEDGPKRLIYISCGFKAFQRDFHLLTDPSSSSSDTGDSSSSKKKKKKKKPSGGRGSRHYTLVHAEGHILFPGADHIETVAIFDRSV